ncbi:PRC-barrel domain-containing protein [Dietzia aurantiaca]|uniref:PRC-barrel domain-containing protein n=1 Tax=Dietzia aurantiaca TaxID=983873 RepID=UPI001E504FCB|nr:PRC-barrel domain-containing protein [Dietzia aurantiaca]MCD2262765.1 PRC-barrel domain-containing protein [Dietzia aurantiaca]
MNLKEQLDALLDATAFDSTGTKVGAVRQVYVDDASGKITFATVSTGIFSADAIVPLHGARLLDDELHLDHTRSVIRDSPRPDNTEDALTPEQEFKLLEYYGIEAPHGGRRESEPKSGAEPGIKADAKVSAAKADVGKADAPEPKSGVEKPKAGSKSPASPAPAPAGKATAPGSAAPRSGVSERGDAGDVTAARPNAKTAEKDGPATAREEKGTTTTTPPASPSPVKAPGSPDRTPGARPRSAASDSAPTSQNSEKNGSAERD